MIPWVTFTDGPAEVKPLSCQVLLPLIRRAGGPLGQGGVVTASGIAEYPEERTASEDS